MVNRKQEEFKNKLREIRTEYWYGETGRGKIKAVMEEFGYDNVYRVTDYFHPFDNYKGQDVIVFDEFMSSLKIQDMLSFLDGNPLELPCRYDNKNACYTKIFIISNISLKEQFTDIQKNYEETWQAFLRRIDGVKVFDRDGTIFFPSVYDFLYNYPDLCDQDDNKEGE